MAMTCAKSKSIYIFLLEHKIKNFNATYEQEDHDGPISLIWAEICILTTEVSHKFTALRFCINFVRDMTVLLNGVAMSYMASSVSIVSSNFNKYRENKPRPIGAMFFDASWWLEQSW